jgi:hypothetical protein
MNELRSPFRQPGINVIQNNSSPPAGQLPADLKSDALARPSDNGHLPVKCLFIHFKKKLPE